jgi:HD-GYP domain-containing protein (c-di-GMP phosphodiesterase class II)
MGGLYHDYGKVKIPAKVLESKNSPAYVNAMNVHAKMGFDALEKLNFLPKQILTIVLEHHEQFNGHGVPNKKKGEDIYGLTKIVSIANIFDNIVSEDKAKGVKNHFHRAFKILEMDNGRLFDPAVLKPALEALKEAYKNGEIAF